MHLCVVCVSPTCLLWIFWSFLIWNVFFSLTCNNKAKCASFPWQKYHRNFLRYWAVKTYYQLLLLLNPVGKIAITTRPASSCLTAVSCSLLRIIFCFSLCSRKDVLELYWYLIQPSLPLFSSTVCHLLPWEMCKGSFNMIDICMALDQSIFSAHWCADYSEYWGFLAGSISNASSPLPFLDHCSTAKTLIAHKTIPPARQANWLVMMTVQIKCQGCAVTEPSGP